jgi:hypothetical protein
VHVAIEAPSFACDLQIQDAASARAIANDLLDAAAAIEAMTRTRNPKKLQLVEN